MIIFMRADESRPGITHAAAEASGAWPRLPLITLFRIFRLWRNVVTGCGRNITTVKIRIKKLLFRGPHTYVLGDRIPIYVVCRLHSIKGNPF